MLRRVPKEKYQRHDPIRPDPVGYCLECWKFYMGGKGVDSLKAKVMSGLASNQDGYGNDTNEAQLAQDTKVGAVTDAAIDSLSKRQWYLVHKINGIAFVDEKTHDVWRYRFADMAAEYEAAKVELGKILSTKADTSYLF